MYVFYLDGKYALWNILEALQGGGELAGRSLNRSTRPAVRYGLPWSSLSIPRLFNKIIECPDKLERCL